MPHFKSPLITYYLSPLPVGFIWGRGATGCAAVPPPVGGGGVGGVAGFGSDGFGSVGFGWLLIIGVHSYHKGVEHRL